MHTKITTSPQGLLYHFTHVYIHLLPISCQLFHHLIVSQMRFFFLFSALSYWKVLKNCWWWRWSEIVEKGKRRNHPNDLLLHNFFFLSLSCCPSKKKSKWNVYISCWDKKNEIEDRRRRSKLWMWILERFWEKMIFCVQMV